jgi:hypothetical protein
LSTKIQECDELLVGGLPRSARRGTLILKQLNPQHLLSLLDPFEALRDSELGTAGAVNPSNVLVDDFSSCDGQTHAEEECSLGLYRPEIRRLFKGGLEELDLGIPSPQILDLDVRYSSDSQLVNGRPDRVLYAREVTHQVEPDRG